MTRFPFSIALCAALLLIMAGCRPAREDAAKAPVEAPIIVVESVPDLVLPLLQPEGGEMHLSSLQGTVVLLDFWVPWSERSVEGMEELSGLHQEFQGHGFSVLGMKVPRGAEGETEGDVVDVSYPLVVASDADLEACGGVRAIPTRILLNAEGEIVKRYEGAVPLKEVRMDVERVLGRMPDAT